MLERLRRRIAGLIAPRTMAVVDRGRIARFTERMFSAARLSRLTATLGNSGSTTEDAETSGSMNRLRAAGRQLERDSNYAGRAINLVQNNVVGRGIGIDPQVLTTRGEENETLNDAIEEAWDEWTCAEYCHTGGAMHFYDMERHLAGQVVAVGEVFVRMWPMRMGDSRIPLALEVIESERIADEYTNPAQINPQITRMGVEVDPIFMRPRAYWVRTQSPGDVSSASQRAQAQYIRVPAEDMIHIRIVRRWPQTRAVSWFHRCAPKLHDMGEYATNELAAARAGAAYFATITKPALDEPMPQDERDAQGNKVMEIQPLAIEELAAGEELQFHAPNRPNQALDPFMKAMLREAAAGISISYAGLSGDYSESNFSSARLAVQDERDQWRALQSWWVRTFRSILHRRWIQAAAMSGTVPGLSLDAYLNDPRRYERVRYKLRGWAYIEPQRDIDSQIAAVGAGMTSLTRVIEQSSDGADVEDVFEEIRKERELAAELGIELNLAPVKASGTAAESGTEGTQPTDGGSTPAPARTVQLVGGRRK